MPKIKTIDQYDAWADRRNEILTRYEVDSANIALDTLGFILAMTTAYGDVTGALRAGSGINLGVKKFKNGKLDLKLTAGRTTYAFSVALRTGYHLETLARAPEEFTREFNNALVGIERELAAIS